MLHTTANKAKEADACKERFNKMAKALGGVKKYGEDTPIPLDKVLEVCGLQDTIWTLRCTIEPSENLLIEFACRCADHVLHFYEDKYPEDNRPRLAIEAARVCLTDKSDAAARAAGNAARAAGNAAWAAGDAAGAAGDAAWAAGTAWAARGAARATENEWQSKALLKLLQESNGYSANSEERVNGHTK